ncbi:hypothetical protein [Yersinia intermedia]|uniref:hypothetical protein n=1 Tax=Yersinia intermedia TaxID=631 RepID=UPI000B70B1AF|nr:hypothetical protein [Yersinia intermedia]MCW8113986.1 hypothetical protein [Yersinia intermedia]MDA5518782.1 hypothetical protein [Yersinia intermedia]OWF92932.1 hypothetical protein B4916_00800 [Yersinia intermedia]
MKVKNLNNTAGKVCGCGTWLQHWKNYTKKSNSLCGNLSCGASSEVGAHVKKVGVAGEHYIVPFCKKCNSISSDDEITIWEGVDLVLASCCK